VVLALHFRATMSYGNEEASTHRRDTRPVLAPDTLDDSVHARELTTEPPTRLRADATPAKAFVQRSAVQPHMHDRPSYVALPPHERTEPSAHAPQPALSRSPRSRSARGTAEVAPRANSVVEAPHPADLAAARRSSSKIVAEAASRSRSDPKLARGSSHSVVEAVPTAGGAPEPAGPIPGLIDPLQIIVPPELGPSIYSWVRRLALQADLQTADRVLRDALLEITSSLAVSIVYPGQDGLWTLGTDDELPRDATPIVACAQARRALISSHTALIPIVTTSETVGVVVLTRNPRNPGYLPVEQIAMIGLARESASILHHLAVQHLQNAHEQKADKGSLYRGEALEAHRTKGNEGELVHLSPGWVRRTYPLLVGALLIAVVFSIFITVPTYSTGSGVVVIDGAQVTAQQGGTVDVVLVQPGHAVNAGTAVIRLSAQAEVDELTAAQTEHNGTLQQMLFDATDEQVKKQLHASHNRLTLAEARVHAKTVRTTKAGTISDIRVRPGQALQPGEPIATVLQPGAEPEIFTFLPSKDRPRLRTGHTIQIELIGYTKTRELATITSVGTEAIGPNEAAKVVGPTLADALKLGGGSYVLVKARLPSRTFKTEHNTLNYHTGLLAKTEVKISEKPFLVTLLPALEKYLPD